MDQAGRRTTASAPTRGTGKNGITAHPYALTYVMSQKLADFGQFLPHFRPVGGVRLWYKTTKANCRSKNAAKSGNGASRSGCGYWARAGPNNGHYPHVR